MDTNPYKSPLGTSNDRLPTAPSSDNGCWSFLALIGAILILFVIGITLDPYFDQHVPRGTPGVVLVGLAILVFLLAPLLIKRKNK